MNSPPSPAASVCSHCQKYNTVWLQGLIKVEKDCFTLDMHVYQSDQSKSHFILDKWSYTKHIGELAGLHRGGDCPWNPPPPPILMCNNVNVAKHMVFPSQQEIKDLDNYMSGVWCWILHGLSPAKKYYDYDGGVPHCIISCACFWPHQTKHRAMLLCFLGKILLLHSRPSSPWANEQTNEVSFWMVVLRYEHFIFKLPVGRPGTQQSHHYYIISLQKPLPPWCPNHVPTPTVS